MISSQLSQASQFKKYDSHFSLLIIYYLNAKITSIKSLEWNGLKSTNSLRAPKVNILFLADSSQLNENLSQLKSIPVDQVNSFRYDQYTKQAYNISTYTYLNKGFSFER